MYSRHFEHSFEHNGKLVLVELYHSSDIITGSIARSANLPVFSLLRGQF